VEKYLKEFGINNLREKTRDRAEWRPILYAAMNLLSWKVDDKYLIG
jgi:hypothetical protein